MDGRKYPRVRIDADVSIARMVSRDVTGRALDLSRGGIRFACVSLIAAVGELVRVSLDLGGARVSIVGKVVRITPIDSFVRELALAFVETDSATDRLLNEYVESTLEV